MQVYVMCTWLLGTADKTETGRGLQPKNHDNFSAVRQIHSDQFVPTVAGSEKHLSRNDPPGNSDVMTECCF